MASPSSTASSASLGFEEKLWKSADFLRGSINAGDYKDIVLGLIFLKYISDAFEARMQDIGKQTQDPKHEYFGFDAKELCEEPDAYASEHVFWVPHEARYGALVASVRKAGNAERINDAMYAIEQANPKLKGVLPRTYHQKGIANDKLGQVIELVGTVGLHGQGAQDKDVLGRVYEYFLGKFASAEGKLGGEFFTPSCIVQLLVNMLEPFSGTVFDPACGSGGMFVQSQRFVKEHGGRIHDISVYGQESNPDTWKLAQMNLAIRGIEAQLGGVHADSFHHDLHPQLKADFVMANPPFNIKEWGGQKFQSGEVKDPRWAYGTPPAGNANYAWVQHFIHHLAPHGHAGFVMANGSMSSNSSGEGEIRERIVRADLVDCMVAMPGQLFYTTQIPVCLWFLARNKKAGKVGDRVLRNRQGETLFIDARKMGEMKGRVLRELTPADIQKISDTYHAWRGEGGEYADVPGFCMSAKIADIEKHGFVLTPGRFVGAEEVEADGEEFLDKMQRLGADLAAQFAESDRLQARIKGNLGVFMGEVEK